MLELLRVSELLPVIYLLLLNEYDGKQEVQLRNVSARTVQ